MAVCYLLEILLFSGNPFVARFSSTMDYTRLSVGAKKGFELNRASNWKKEGEEYASHPTYEIYPNYACILLIKLHASSVVVRSHANDRTWMKRGRAGGSHIE